MASPLDLARQVAGFDEPAVRHLQRLIRTWGLLADLALGDALVLAPTIDDDRVFVVLGNVRASTASTLYTNDPIGDRHRVENRPMVATAWDTGELQTDVVELGPHFPDGSASIVAARFSLEGCPLGVVLRERRIIQREFLQLEKTYLGLSDRLMQMVSDG
jgi:hypothetical protein